MKEALAGTQHEPEHELSGALRLHEGARRWWQGVGAALSRGVEGSQARAILGFQITFCGVDTVFLQVALENATDGPPSEDVNKAKAALTEVREIEAKVRDLLAFVSQPATPPSQEQLGRGMGAYERGETEDMKAAAARLRARRSSEEAPACPTTSRFPERT
jgi:hypothetical protein